MKTVFNERLCRAMFMKRIRQADLVERTGIDKGSISSYVSGRYKPNSEKLIKLATALGVDPAWLSGDAPDIDPVTLTKSQWPGESNPSTQTIPILGKVAAGEPIFADENLIGTLTIEDPRSDLFALHITGDSMSPRIMDGDLVLVHKQNTANDGDLVIALHEDAATCKVYRKNSWGVSLVPFNTSYAPFVFSGSDAAEQLQIIGKVIGSYHSWE